MVVYPLFAQDHRINIVCRGGDLMGHSHMTLHPFNEPYAQLRPQCLTDSDMDQTPISLAGIPASTEDEKHYVPGLNAFADLFMTWWHAKLDIAHKTPTEALRGGLAHVQHVLDNLPPEIRWRGGLSRPPGATLGHDKQMVHVLITSLYIKSNLLQRIGVFPSILTHQDIIK